MRKKIKLKNNNNFFRQLWIKIKGITKLNSYLNKNKKNFKIHVLRKTKI